VIKYKVTGYSDRAIQKIKIEKETNHFVFYKDGNSERVWQEAKGMFFDTFDAAKNYILKEAQCEIANLDVSLERAKQRLAKAEALTE
jgi:hypothetical protein